MPFIYLFALAVIQIQLDVFGYGPVKISRVAVIREEQIQRALVTACVRTFMGTSDEG